MMAAATAAASVSGIREKYSIKIYTGTDSAKWGASEPARRSTAIFGCVIGRSNI